MILRYLRTVGDLIQDVCIFTIDIL